MQKLGLFFLILFFTVSAFCQYTITGRVTNNLNTPLEFATVNLKNDTNEIVSTLTDSLGNFKLVDIKQSNCLLSFSYISYTKKTLQFSLTIDTIINIVLVTKDTLAEEVVVSSTQRIFERKSDKFIFNVEGLKGGKGNNAWDILTQTPLVNTNEQGSISISGTDGATIYINFRKSFLSGEALVNFLKSIGSESVLQIEVITVPSSKFESEGGGGVINIVLKKNESEGIKGTITLADRQTTNNSQTLDASVNYRKKTIDIYSYLNCSNQNLHFAGSNTIDYIDNSKIYYQNTNDIKRILKNKFEIAPTVGIDYNVSKKVTIGILAEYSNTSLIRNNTTKSAFINTSNSIIDSLLQTSSKNNEKTNYISTNINYLRLIDSAGSQLNISLDYLKYNEARNTEQTTDAIDIFGTIGINKDYFRSILPQKITNAAFEIDYTKILNGMFSIETGIRVAESNTADDVKFNILKDNQLINDTARSNFFKYSENIYSGYGLVKQKINDKWDYESGLRIENTKTTGQLINKNQVNKNGYTYLFPTVFLNFTPNREHQFSFAYTERINRPSFWDINPFRYYTSKNIYITGNPFLLPSVLRKQEITYIYESKLIIQLFHSKASNAFASLIYSDSIETYQKQTNYGGNDMSGINLLYSNRIKPFWFFRVNANMSFIGFKGAYQSNVINQTSAYPTISFLNGFTISKERKIYTTINIANVFKHYSQNVLVKNRFVSNVDFTKINSGNKLQFGLSVSDIFKTAWDNYLIQETSQNFKEKYYYDSRGVSLSVKYNFGSQKIKNERERNTSNSEEKERIN